MQVPSHLNLYAYKPNLLQTPSTTLLNPTPQINITYALINLQQNILNQQNLLKLYLQQQQTPSLSPLASLLNSNTPLQRLAPQPQEPKLFQEDIRHILLRQSQQSQLLNTNENLLKLHKTTTFSDEETHSTQLKVKSEDTNISETKEVSNDNCAFSNRSLDESAASDEEEFMGKENIKILRRNNAFKPQKKSQKHDDEESYGEAPRRSNKLIDPKRPPSKAKHLWINYGRKIIDFAVNQTKDEVQNKVKQLIGRLSSKKDFEDVFGLTDEDTEEEKNFKVVFGKLALVFVNFKAEAAFEGSKYKEQMMSQKKVVSSWISKLIKE